MMSDPIRVLTAGIGTPIEKNSLMLVNATTHAKT